MSIDASELKSDHPDTWVRLVTVLGGSSAATMTVGRGVTLTYGGSGLLTLTWKENPGLFLGLDASFQATTMAALKGYTVVAGVFNTTTNALALTVYNSSFAATDLAALQWLSLRIYFKESALAV